MKITCFIFTYGIEAPMLPWCISTARNGSVEIDVSFVVVEDGNAPLPAAVAENLQQDPDVTVVRSVQPRMGNLRGVNWFAEQVMIMSDHAGDADIVCKIDPDTLVLSLQNAAAPLLTTPSMVGCGRGVNDLFFHGPCYFVRRWLVDYLAAKYDKIKHVETSKTQEVVDLMTQKKPTPLTCEDMLMSREALSFGTLGFGQNSTSWMHDRDSRNLWDVRNNFDVVLFRSPPPIYTHGEKGALVVAKTMEALLSATPPAPAPSGKPTVVLGYGPGRSGTTFIASLLNLQNHAWVSHEAYSPVMLNASNVSRFAKRLVETRTNHALIGDITPCHTWMIPAMARWLLEEGYGVKLVETTRDEEDLVASWMTMIESLKHDPFVTTPPPGWRHNGWSPAYPKFDDIPSREDRVRAYIAWCGQCSAAIKSEFPGLVFSIDVADMNDPAKIHTLFDWLGLPSSGRRLELLGTPINAAQ
jgi:hypothetical protein